MRHSFPSPRRQLVYSCRRLLNVIIQFYATPAPSFPKNTLETKLKRLFRLSLKFTSLRENFLATRKWDGVVHFKYLTASHVAAQK